MISLDWYDSDHTLLHMRIEDAWDLTTSRQGIEEYHRRVREVSHRVDLIAQALDKRAMHPPLWVLRMGVHGILSSAPNMGLIVIVPDNTRLQALVFAGIRVLGERYAARIYTAPTFDAAYKIIEESRQ